MTDTIFVIISLLILALLSLLILKVEGCRSAQLLRCAIPVLLAFFLRWYCMEHITYDYTDFLSQWAAYFRNNGGWAAVKDSVGNYNVPYLYFLAAISYIPVSDLYLIKLFSIIFDVVLAWGVLRLVKFYLPNGSNASSVAFCVTLLLPTVVLNGAYWGQCDSLYVALCLHALVWGLQKAPRRSVIFLALAFAFKLQTVFIIPLWCALWFSKRIGFRHLWYFPITYILTMVPALLLGKPLTDILEIYVGQTTEYATALSYNAPSIYALLPYGYDVPVGTVAIWGIIAAFVLVAILLILLFIHRHNLDSAALLTAAAILAVGVPFLLPYMHDRYFFLADILTVVLACISLPYISIALLTQLASASSYATYLRLQYTFPLNLGDYIIPMGFEALMMLLVFITLWVILISQLAGGKSYSKRRRR